MPNRVVSSRQWNNVYKSSSFIGSAHQKKDCSSFSSSSSSSSSSVSTTSHQMINLNTRHTPCRRSEDDVRCPHGLALHLLPRTLSTATSSTWDAPPRSTNSQQEQQQQQQQEEPPSPSVFASNQEKCVTSHNSHASFLMARSSHLEEVAIGTIVDQSVCIKDYFQVLQAWMDVARQEEQRHPGKASSSSSSSSSSSLGGLEAARRARSLLRALECNFDPVRTATSTSAAVLIPTALMYDMVLQAYAVSGGGIVAAKEAEELLEHMLDKARGATGHQRGHTPSTTNYPEPIIKSYNKVLHCWAKAKCKDSAIRAEGVLTRMEEWRQHCRVARQDDPSFPHRGCYPTAATLNSLINALAKSKAVHAPYRAWQLLQEVVKVQRNPVSMPDHRYRDVRLDPWLFNAVIVSWTRSNRGRDAAAKAEEILSLAGTLNAEGLMKKLPCKRTYTLVLDAWSRCENSTGECAQRAHDLLFRLIRLYRQRAPIEFDSVAFGTCILAWSRCANLKSAPEKAEAILQELLSLHNQTGLVDFQPTFVVWNSLQAVWLHATERPDSMDRCAEILQRMQKHGCQPTIVSYGKVLRAAGRRGLGDQALALLDQYALNSKFPLHRDVRCLTIVLDALARESRDDAMDRATAFFEKMKGQDSYANPDEYSYTILLDALLRSKGGRHAERGRDLLKEMMQRSCRPDAHVVSIVLRLCANTTGTVDDRRRALDIALETFQQCESYYGVSPNVFVYTGMLHAINCLTALKDLRVEGVWPAERGRDILEEMMQRFQQGDDSCRPDAHVVSIVLRLCANTTGTVDDRRRALDIALETFEKCESYCGVSPNVFVYTAMLHAINCLTALKDLRVEGGWPAERGRDILEEMMQRFQQGDDSCRPNTRIVSSVLRLCANTTGTVDDRRRALDIALETFEKCESYYGVSPNGFAYIATLEAITCLTATKDVCVEGCRHAEQGRDILEAMMQRFQQGDDSCRPDAHVVSIVLRLCANTTGTVDDRRRALDIALETFQKCESCFGVSRSSVVYTGMLHAINCLSSSNDQRWELLEKVFEECRTLGHVSVAVKRTMHRGGASHCLSGLTASSSRQVPHKHRPRSSSVGRGPDGTT